MGSVVGLLVPILSLVGASAAGRRRLNGWVGGLRPPRPLKAGPANRQNRSPCAGSANFVWTAAERAGVDSYWVLRNLRRNAVMAMRVGDRAAAARSLELIGRHLGLFIDKKQMEINVVDDADEYLAKIIALVDGKVIDNELPVIDIKPDDSVH